MDITVQVVHSISPATLAALAGLANPNHQLDRIEAGIAQLQKGDIMAQATLDDILAESKKQSTVGASAIALLQQLFALRNDSVKLQATFDQMTSDEAALGAAITANTPAAGPAA